MSNRDGYLAEITYRVIVGIIVTGGGLFVIGWRVDPMLALALLPVVIGTIILGVNVGRLME